MTVSAAINPGLPFLVTWSTPIQTHHCLSHHFAILYTLAGHLNLNSNGIVNLRDTAMIFTFNQYELDTSRYTLHCDGALVSILPKTFELLAYLVEHHGHTVSKEDLYNYLWPDQIVSESALVYHIAAARKAIGDSGQRQTVIKTVYSRGYHFIAPVESHEQDSPAPSVRGDDRTGDEPCN